MIHTQTTRPAGIFLVAFLIIMLIAGLGYWAYSEFIGQSELHRLQAQARRLEAQAAADQAAASLERAAGERALRTAEGEAIKAPALAAARAVRAQTTVLMFYGLLAPGLIIGGVALLFAAAIAGGVAVGLWGDRLWRARMEAGE